MNAATSDERDDWVPYLRGALAGADTSRLPLQESKLARCCSAIRAKSFLSSGGAVRQALDKPRTMAALGRLRRGALNGFRAVPRAAATATRSRGSRNLVIPTPVRERCSPVVPLDGA